MVNDLKLERLEWPYVLPSRVREKHICDERHTIVIGSGDFVLLKMVAEGSVISGPVAEADKV